MSPSPITLHHLLTTSYQIDVSPGLYAESLHGMAACADFIAYSVMTVIYRAQSRPTDTMAVSSQCYEAARLALDSHLKCFDFFRGRQTHKKMEYVHWFALSPSHIAWPVTDSLGSYSTHRSLHSSLSLPTPSLRPVPPIFLFCRTP